MNHHKNLVKIGHKLCKNQKYGRRYTNFFHIIEGGYVSLQLGSLSAIAQEPSATKNGQPNPENAEAFRRVWRTLVADSQGKSNSSEDPLTSACNFIE